MNWYYMEGNQQQGPVGDDVIKVLVQSGKLGIGSLVRTENMSDWRTSDQTLLDRIAAGETGLAPLFARGRGAQDPFATGANEPVTLLLLLPDGQMANYCLGQAPLVIGSSSDCDVVIAEEQGVSGKQASLALRNRKVFIENIGGATKLNGLDVLGSAAVHTGDSIQVGCWNAVIRMREPVPDVPEPEQAWDETVAQRPFFARVRDSFRAASRRVALASELRKHEAALASFVQDLDAACIAIGEKAEKTASGNAPCAWQADVDGALAAVARARDSLSAEASARDARTAELSQASGVRRDAKAEHAVKVAAIDRELAALTRDMASKELERQRADAEIAALDGKLKLVQNAIASVGSGQVTESAEDLLGAKAAITRKIDAVTETRDAAAADAAKFKELAAAKTREREAAAKAGAALDAAERAAAETEKATKAAFDQRVGRAAKALQDARGELGRAMLKHVAAPEGFDGLYAAARAAEAGRTDSEVRIASVRNDIEAVAPEVRRLAIGACAVAAVTVVVCVALAGGAFRRWRDDANERRDGEMFARAVSSVMEMLGRQRGEAGEQQPAPSAGVPSPATQGATQPNALMQAGAGRAVVAADRQANEDYDGTEDLRASEALESLAKKAGMHMKFQVIASLSFDGFPGLECLGANLYEIMVYYYEPDPCTTKKKILYTPLNQKPLGRALLVTREVKFSSEGTATLPVIFATEIKIKQTSGFESTARVYVEALESDIKAYSVALRAERARHIQNVVFARHVVSEEELADEVGPDISYAEKTRLRSEKAKELWARAFKPVAGGKNGYLFLAIPDGIYEVRDVTGGDGHEYRVQLFEKDGKQNSGMALWLTPDTRDPLVRVKKGTQVQLVGYFNAVECTLGQRYLRRTGFLFKEVSVFAVYLDRDF